MPGHVDPEAISKLLQGLCELLQTNKNLYAVRSLYRTVQLAQDNIVQFAEVLGQVIAAFIDAAARDEAQSSPNYIYILFETAALTLRHLKGHPEVFAHVENILQSPLNFIITQNVTDMIAYAFQLYAIFVANSSTMQPVYKTLADSIIQNKNNWEKGMAYLIPALANFCIAMIYKYPDMFFGDPTNLQRLQENVNSLMKPEIRMESQAMQIASAIFEKLGTASGGLNE